VTCFDGYVVNGYTFHTKAQVKNLSTQNCGVLVKADVHSGEKEYFGALKEIIELDSDSNHEVILFDYEWCDVFPENAGIKRETYGITIVNVKRFLKTNEPYFLACEVEQVYYVKDHLHQNWQVVVKTNPHNFYGIPSNDEGEGAKSFSSSDNKTNEEAYIPVSNHGAMSLVRNDAELDVVGADLVAQQLQCYKKKGEMQVVDDSSESGSSGEEDIPLFRDEIDDWH